MIHDVIKPYPVVNARQETGTTEIQTVQATQMKIPVLTGFTQINKATVKNEDVLLNNCFLCSLFISCRTLIQVNFL
jgi:hypothetical protein